MCILCICCFTVGIAAGVEAGVRSVQFIPWHCECECWCWWLRICVGWWHSCRFERWYSCWCCSWDGTLVGIAAGVEAGVRSVQFIPWHCECECWCWWLRICVGWWHSCRFERWYSCWCCSWDGTLVGIAAGVEAGVRSVQFIQCCWLYLLVLCLYLTSSRSVQVA